MFNLVPEERAEYPAEVLNDMSHAVAAIGDLLYYCKEEAQFLEIPENRSGLHVLMRGIASTLSDVEAIVYERIQSPHADGYREGAALVQAEYASAVRDDYRRGWDEALAAVEKINPELVASYKESAHVADRVDDGDPTAMDAAREEMGLIDNEAGAEPPIPNPTVGKPGADAPETATAAPEGEGRRKAVNGG